MPNIPDITLHVYQILEEEYAAVHGSIPAEPLLFRMPTGEVEATLGWELRRGHLRDPLGLASCLLNGAAESREGAAAPCACRPDDPRMKALREYLLGRLGEKVSAQLTALAGFEVVTASFEEGMRAGAGGGLTEGEKAEGEKAAAAGDKVASSLEALLIKKLNEVALADPDLFDAKRFSGAWLRASTQELLSARAAAAKEAERAKKEADKAKKKADKARVVDREKTAAGEEAAKEAGKEAAAVEKQADEVTRRLNRLLLEDAFPGCFERIYDIRLSAMFHRLHAAETSALCLSGGGIRSGTFALGLLQGLARRDLLQQFDYLSTVSGGGYVGSWLTAWLHRHPEGLAGVSRELKNTPPATRVDPDPQAVQNLREYSNFLTPKPGLLTADTWSFVGIYLRNLLLNWLVFIPLLAAVLILPRLMLNVTLMQPTGDPSEVASALKEEAAAEGRVPATKARLVEYRPEPISEDFFDLPLVRRLYEPPLSNAFGTNKSLYSRHVMLLLGFGFGVWALAFVIFNRPGVRGRLRRRSPKWHDRTDQRSFIRFCLTPLLISASCLTVYWAWSQEGASAPKQLAAFLVFGAAFIICAKLVATLVLSKYWPGGGDDGGAEPEEKGSWNFWGGLKQALALLTAAVVAGLLFALAALSPAGDPVVGYGATLRGGKLIRLPFEWTDWTKWTWWGSWTTEMYVCLGVPIFLLIYWASLTAYVGVSSADTRIQDEDREWWARFGAWLLIAAIAWLALTALVIYGPLALLESPRLLGAVGGLSGLAAVILGRSAVTPAGGKDAQGGSKGSKLLALLGGAIPVFGAVFLAAFVAFVSLGTSGLTRKLVTLADENLRAKPTPDPATGQTPPAADGDGWMVQWLTNVPEDAEEGPHRGPNRGFDDHVRYITPVVPTLTRPTPTPLPGATPCQPVCGAADAAGEKPEEADAFKGAQIVHLNVLHHTSLWLTLLMGSLLLAAGVLLSRMVNLNLFSLHGGYRNRLIRAFLGASRPSGERRPNPFTGFDPADNLSMHELRWALFDEGDFLRPEALAKKLLEENGGLAAYLRGQNLLENVKRESGAAGRPGLVAALRADLNGVLQRVRLDEHESFAKLFESEPAAGALATLKKAFRRPADEASWKGEILSEYQLLLNRLVLTEAFGGMIRQGPPPPYKMLHIVNTSLNLVGGEKLAWQHRKAEPFSISPLHSGCFRLGYRRSRDYGGRDTDGISLGTAAAISGAAASSNMGYFTTSPVISLLLTLFNVRLGWWLGNPGPAGQTTYFKHRPDYSVVPVLSEAFGLTSNRYRYVYLTDGGHFENLAVYEMVLRRCRFIIVADGAQDEEFRFGDLGNAVRKIRIDLGVPIDFPCIAIHGGKDGAKGMYWAIGRIRYSCLEGAAKEKGEGEEGGLADGLLLYIKPAVYGDEPRDVIEYKNSFPDFPHQSTGDQFFDEPQFESYRALGSHIMDRLCGEGSDALQVKDVIARARDEMLKHCGDLDPDFLKWLGRLAGDQKTDPPRGMTCYELMVPPG